MNLYIKYILSVLELLSFYILCGLPMVISKFPIFYIDLSVLHATCLYYSSCIDYSKKRKCCKNKRKVLSLISKISFLWFDKYKKYCIKLYIDIIISFILGVLSFVKGLILYKKINFYTGRIEYYRNKISFKYHVINKIYTTVLTILDDIKKSL